MYPSAWPVYYRSLLGLLLGCLVVLAAEPPANLVELREARRQAANRPRRIIFNNDGNEPVYKAEDNSAEKLLATRTTPLVGSQVDSIFYCSWSSGFGLFTHDTKVGQVFSTKEGLFAPNRTVELLAAGTDPLKVTTEFGHKHGMEVLWSFRMNDTHDGSATDYGPIMLRANRLKTEHPEYMIGTAQNKPKFGVWTAVDYTLPEIRELAFRYVEEVCQRYDIDGVELDFFRHPVFFRRAAMTGTACDDHERALMTELMVRIRAMTEAEGLRRGRPILVAVRLPDSVEYCRETGLDLEQWLSGGLIDLFIPSGYFQLNEWEYSVELGHRYGVKVYPSLDESRVRDLPAKAMRSTVLSYRGRAAAAWQAGADGVYLFNSFDPKNPIWRELGDMKILNKLDKDYFASIRGAASASGNSFPYLSRVNVPLLNPGKVIAVKGGETVRSTFNANEENLEGRSVAKLSLQFKNPIESQQVKVSLNGIELTDAQAQKNNWIEYTLRGSDLKTGRNTVEVSLPTGAKTNAWSDLRCTVRTKK
ncbi:MAG: hypothetical protein EBQ59_03900 [Verrucomicrobia bacterium]|nr:hypothetical protein [Verrucomicrobiota bacterium]